MPENTFLCRRSFRILHRNITKNLMAALLTALSICFIAGTGFALDTVPEEIKKTNRIGVADETPSYAVTLKASAKAYITSPSFRPTAVATLKKGDTVILFKESRMWSDTNNVLILYNDTLAYMKKSSLEKAKDGSIKKSDLPDGAFFIQPTANVTIYKQASKLSKRLSMSLKSIVLAAVSENDEFYEVMWGNSTGFIDKSRAVPYNSERFKIELLLDKTEYAVNEKIDIKATLEYVGAFDEILLWLNTPSMVITVSDDKGFETGGMLLDMSSASYFKKKEVYTFDFSKSGVYDPDAPDAAFWKKFYDEPDLYLLKGEYTVRAFPEASLCDSVIGSEIRPLAEKKIVVK